MKDATNLKKKEKEKWFDFDVCHRSHLIQDHFTTPWAPGKLQVLTSEIK